MISEQVAELLAASEDALAWIRGVRCVGDGWDDGTEERLAAAIAAIKTPEEPRR